MTIASILYTLLISPLELFFEALYSVTYSRVGDYGLSIVVLSLAVNFLVLPLYQRADVIQEDQRTIEKKLEPWVKHIKRTFKGDERMMMLDTFYRQNNYRPTDVFKGSVSLLLQVPFFIAAYNFLSNLQCIKGVSFGPIENLGAPDQLLLVGGISLNLLPILMTLMNFLSTAIYTRGFPLKTKIQLYGMAVVFLLLLYTSPSGLVFYWTLNNLFSLAKNLVLKLKKLWVQNRKQGSISIDEKKKLNGHTIKLSPSTKVFVMGAVFASLLIGLLIPSAVLSASPQEFIDVTHYVNPNWYMLCSLLLALGTFFIWFGVFYWIFDDKGKCFLEWAIWAGSLSAILDYMIFHKSHGNISNNLIFENALTYTRTEKIENLLVLLLVLILLVPILKKWKRQLSYLMLAGLAALGIMCGRNLVSVQEDCEPVAESIERLNERAHWTLSTKGQNVIVMMLDRGLAEYVPYIMEERPELKEQFAGFTYYDNTISFGAFTNVGSPSVYGGYEYTPTEMNARDTELLVDKHDEALKVMPLVFLQNGFDVTVCDPTYAGYGWVPDTSIYDEYEGINCFLTEGKFTDETIIQRRENFKKRNFFCYGLTMAAPLFLQKSFYNQGEYHSMEADASTQQNALMDSYCALTNLTNLTQISEDGNHFLMMSNSTTHNDRIMDYPSYTPHTGRGKAKYTGPAERKSEDGRVIKLSSKSQIAHYEANMAAFIQLGQWFDYLRQMDVYDNTRIIIVSDHGRDVGQFPELVLDTDNALLDMEFYYPLLMVKDFGDSSFQTSSEFMTNADTPVLAFQNLFENPANPFTGKAITGEEKNSGDLLILGSDRWDTDENNGTTYLPGIWIKSGRDVWAAGNFEVLE